jgi:hypothetical protein
LFEEEKATSQQKSSPALAGRVIIQFGADDWLLPRSRQPPERGGRRKLPDAGVCTSISDVENVSKSYVSRILRLALLAPDIVEAVLAGRADQALKLETLERPLPVSWEEQRRGSGSGGSATVDTHPITRGCIALSAAKSVSRSESV